MKINYCLKCGRKTFSKHLGDDFVQICPDCKRMYQDIFYTCVIILCVNEEGKVAVIKQSYGKDRYVLVAGFMQPLETLEQAVEREVKEELGLDCNNISYIKSIPMEKNENLMVAFRTNVSGQVKLSSEVKEVKFVEKEEALKLLSDAKIAYEVVRNM